MGGRDKKRQHLIDVARLLGYVIQPVTSSGTWHSNRMAYNLVKPDGEFVMLEIKEPHTGIGVWEFARPLIFKHIWEAAARAIELEGLDARVLKPPGEDRVGSCRVPEVFEQRNRVERVLVRTKKAPHRRR